MMFISSEQVILLRIDDFNWMQPPNQRSGMEPKNSESKIGAPEPRANCTANLFKDKVYIFGGHGGIGYQRTSYNDIYYFGFIYVFIFFDIYYRGYIFNTP